VARPLGLPGRLPDLLRTDGAGGLALVAATAIALAMANGPAHIGWADLWHGPAHRWVNDGLMTLFFYVVGAEIAREVTEGELRDRKTALAPALAAVGGMVAPALLFLAVVRGTAGARGWGIPMATDIAFAVSALALLGPRVPDRLKLFLLTLAVVDDLGAILVIAVVYGDGTHVGALAVALGIVATLVLLRRAGVERFLPYLVLGVGLWFALDHAGVHPTLAGVALALASPAAWRDRLEHRLAPMTSLVVLPVFALANAGVRLTAEALDRPGAHRLAIGIAVALVVGKLVGITATTWLADRSGIGRRPDGATWPQVAGTATIAGIGFTVSLFVADLAFPGSELADAAKLGILAGSLLAAGLGLAALRWTTTRDV
jgi:NhaA family Na+:H+ antiporter